MPDSLFNPYPGLRPFASDEDYLFFGREEQTAELLRRLGRSRFVAVVGTSGSGKSSLVRCGLLSELQGGGMVEAGSHWEIAVMKPGGDPIRHLAESLLRAELYDPEDAEALDRVSATLRRSDAGLVEAVRQSDLDGGANLVLVVDQFEEIFRFHRASSAGAEDAPDFVRLLLEASRSEAPPIYIILTMRSDFLGDCSRFAGLAEAVNDGEYLIPRLNREQTRAAIEGPAKVAGGSISWRLMVRLLNDVENQVDRLPVLQHALMRLWDAWARDHQADEPLDLRHYEAIGGLAEALSLHADEVFADLPDDRARFVCAKLFKALTEKGVDNRGVRRPARVDRLGAIAGSAREEITIVINAFRQPGVTFLMPGEEVALEAETVIDISHESLMRGWRRLSEWVEEEAQSVRIYRRLLDTAQLWNDGRAGLYHDPDLQIARTWFEEEKPGGEWASQYGGGFAMATRFLDASHEAVAREAREREQARQRELEQANALAEIERKRAEEQKRGAGRLRRLLAAAALIAAVAVAASVVAVRQSRKAAKSEEATASLAAEFRDRMVRGDFDLSAEKVQSGDEAGSLAYLARALRNDPGYSAAAMRAMTTLTNGRFPVERFPVIKHGAPISSHLHNGKHDLLATWSEKGSEVRLWDLATGKERELAGRSGEERLGPDPGPPDPEATAVIGAAIKRARPVWLAGDTREAGSGEPRFFRKVIELPSDRRLLRADLYLMVDDEFGLSVNGTAVGSGDVWNKTYHRGLDPTALGQRVEILIEAWNHQDQASVVAAVMLSFSDGNEPLVITSDASWQSSTRPEDGFVDSKEFAAKPFAGDNLERMPSSDRLRWIQWSADGNRMLAYSVGDGGVVTWDLATGNRLRTFPSRVLGQGCKVSNYDEPGDIVGRRDPEEGSLQVWNLTTGEAVGSPMKTEGSVIEEQWMFTPDGRYLIGLFSDAVIAAWDIVTGEEVGRVTTRPVRATQLQISRDGRYVIARDEVRRLVNWWELDQSGFGEGRDWIELPFLFQPDGPDPGNAPDKTWRWRILASGEAITFFGEAQEDADAYHVVSYRLDGERTQVADILTGAIPRNAGVSRRLGYPGNSWDDSHRVFGTVQGVRIDLWDMGTGERFPRPLFAPEILADAMLSPDGRHVVATSLTKGFSSEAGAAQKKLFVFDVFTGRLVFPRPIALRSSATKIFFSPDGETLLTTDPDVNLVRFWDLGTGREIRAPVAAWAVDDAVFASSGKRVALYQKANTFFDNGERMELLAQTTGEFLLHETALAPAIPDFLIERRGRRTGTMVFAPSEGGQWMTFSRPPDAPTELQIWDAGRAEEIRSMEYGVDASRAHTGTQWSLDGRRVIFSDHQNRARVVDTGSGETLHEFDLGVPVHKVALSADGSTAACGGARGMISTWSKANGEATFRPFGLETSYMDALDLSDSGSLLAAGHRNNAVRLFVVIDSATGQRRLGPREVLNAVEDIKITPDEQSVIVSEGDATIPMIGLESGETVREFKVSQWSRRLHLSPDGRLLAAGSGSEADRTYGEAFVFDVATGRMVTPPLPHEGAVFGAWFSPDASIVATSVFDPEAFAGGGGIGFVQLWDVASGNSLTDPIGERGFPISIAFQPDGSAVAAGWSSGVCQTIPIPARTVAPAWIPGLVEAVGGKRLSTGSEALEEVPDAQLSAFRERVLAEDPALASDGEWFRWAGWLFEDQETRTVSPGSRTMMARHLARLRASEEIEDLRQAVRLNPNDGKTFARLAVRRLEGAPDDLDPICRPHWNDSAGWYSDRAIALAPEDSEVWAMRAEVMHQLGRRELAAEAAAMAVTLLPPDVADPSVQYQAALAQVAAGRMDEAKRSFDRALRQMARYQEKVKSGQSAMPVSNLLAEFMQDPPSPDGVAGSPRAAAADILPDDPIPGTYQDFDEVMPGALPEGWRVWNRSDPGSQAGVRHLRNWQSDVWKDWAVVRRQQLEWGAGPTRARILRPGVERRPVVHGKRGALLEGGFALAVSENRRGFQIQYLETPDFDCSGRKGVHLAFNSAYESISRRMGALEFSLDRGRTWQPLVYFVHAFTFEGARKDSGEIDLPTLLSAKRTNFPWWLDAENGTVRGGAYGAFVAPAGTPGLADRFEGRTNDQYDYKKREVFALPEADGAPTVRLRFGSIGSSSLYWAIDKVGLYESRGVESPDGRKAPAAKGPSHAGNDAVGLAIQALGEGLGVDAGDGLISLADVVDAVVGLAEEVLLGSSAGSGQRRTGDGVPVGALEALLLTGWARDFDAGDADARTVMAAAEMARALVGEGAQEMADLPSLAPALGRAQASLLSSADLLGDLANEEFRRSFVLLTALRGLVVGKSSNDLEGGRALVALAGVICDEDSAVIGVVRKAHAVLAGRDPGAEEEALVLLERGSVWNYFYTGTSPGPGWKDPDFDDAGWSQGPARLGYSSPSQQQPSDGEVTRFLKIGPGGNDKFTTAYFRTTFEVEDPSQFGQIVLRMQRDDGAVVYLNGREIRRDNLPAGTITNETFAISTVSGEDEQIFHRSLVNDPPLEAGRNTLAVEVHQKNLTSSDLGFDLEVSVERGLVDDLDILGGAESLPVARLSALGIPPDVQMVYWHRRINQLLRAERFSGALEALSRLSMLERIDEKDPRLLRLDALVAQSEGRLEDARRLYAAAMDEVVRQAAAGAIPHVSLLPNTLRQAAHMVGGSPADIGFVYRVLSLGGWVAEAELELVRHWAEASIAGDPDGLEQIWLGLSENLGDHDGAVALAREVLATLPEPGADAPATEMRRYQRWLQNLESGERALGNVEGADALLAELEEIPERSPGLSSKSIDLSGYYNGSLYDGRAWSNDPRNNLASLAETFVPIRGVAFDLRGVIQLNSGALNSGQTTDDLVVGGKLPAQVSGIPVGLKTSAMHFLTSTQWGQEEQGVEVARFVVHYEDGTEENMPVLFRDHVADWGSESGVPLEHVGWRGAHDIRPSVVLFELVWKNPHPDRTIATVDFISTEKRAAPFLVAITLE